MAPARTSSRSCGRYSRTGARPPATPTLRANIDRIGSSTPCGAPTYPTGAPGRARGVAGASARPAPPPPGRAAAAAPGGGRGDGAPPRLAALGDDVGGPEL